jgi:hypothetical protein
MKTAEVGLDGLFKVVESGSIPLRKRIKKAKLVKDWPFY